MSSNKLDGTERLNVSIPREFTPSIKQKSEDLNITPSHFCALCAEACLEMMDAKSPTMPYFVMQYRFLKENKQLRSQNAAKSLPKIPTKKG